MQDSISRLRITEIMKKEGHDPPNMHSYYALQLFMPILKISIIRWQIHTFSMTSVLPHTVAEPIRWRFLPKKLVIFVIELAFPWSWVNKNHQHLIFKVNFLCQKSVLLFWFVSVKIIRLGVQLMIYQFLITSIFEVVYFLTLGPIFVTSYPSERKSNHKNN